MAQAAAERQPLFALVLVQLPYAPTHVTLKPMPR